MPTSRADRHPSLRRRRRALAPTLGAGLVLLGGLLAACGGDPPPSRSTPVPDDGRDAGRTHADTGQVESVPPPEALNPQLERLLSRRAAAVRDGDVDAFLRTVDDRTPGFLETQEGYFANLAQLPLATFDYALYPASLVRERDSYWGVVEVTLQLDGFDDLPVRTLDRFRFSPGDDGRMRVSSVTDTAWEEENSVLAQPWDLQPVEVRTGPGVLGVFDAGTVAQADELMRSVRRGSADVRTRVPYPWTGTAVFYALSDLRFLERIEDLPGDPGTLDGVAFTVPAGPDDARVAATRFAVNPERLGGEASARDRLVRHELTHLAVGAQDDTAPVWVAEGLAEWVSVQAMAPQDRRVPAEAVAAARAGIRGMPDDASFNDDASEEHYAVSWWTMEYLARTYGENAPWALLDAIAGREGDVAVVEDLLRLSVDQLARRGAKLMVAGYGRRAATEPPPQG